MKKKKFSLVVPGDLPFDIKKVILKSDKKAIIPEKKLTNNEMKVFARMGGMGGVPDFMVIDVVMGLPGFLSFLFDLVDRYRDNKFPFNLLLEKDKKKISIDINRQLSSKTASKIVDFFV